MYSEISLPVIWTYFYLFAYYVIGIICFIGVFVKIIRLLKSVFSRISVTANIKLYLKYFDSQKTDKKTITDAKASKGSNCVDWGQVYYRIAKSLGYDVQFVHVKCRVLGTGHIRLRLRHKKHTGGNWINRDPAAVADTTSGNVRAI